MREVTVKVYTFAELDEKAKARALDHFRDVNTDHDWHDLILEEWGSKLKDEIGIEKADIRFSGFWSQGDGASFSGTIDEAWILAFVRAHADSYPLLAVHLGASEDNPKAEIYEAQVDRIGSFHYVHEKTCKVSLDVRCSSGEFTDGETKALFAEVFRLRDALDDLRCGLCWKIYRDLETEYEYLTGAEAIQSTIEANEYEFDEHGNQWT